LYETILYLLRECNKTNQTFAEMIRVMKLSHSVRKIIFSRKMERGTDYNVLCVDVKMPEPLEEIDNAVLCLLESAKLCDRAKQCFSKIEILVKEM